MSVVSLAAYLSPRTGNEDFKTGTRYSWRTMSLPVSTMSNSASTILELELLVTYSQDSLVIFNRFPKGGGEKSTWQSEKLQTLDLNC